MKQMDLTDVIKLACNGPHLSTHRHKIVALLKMFAERGFTLEHCTSH